MKKVSDPNSNLDHIEEPVEIDQAITAQMLKVSNKLEFLDPGEPRIVTIHDPLQRLLLRMQKICTQCFSFEVDENNQVSKGFLL